MSINISYVTINVERELNSLSMVLARGLLWG
jgi:hypothetical protein